MLQLFSAFVKDEEGQGLVEYALLLALIAIVSIAILQSLGNQVKTTFTKVRDALK
jgi:pilus assembly protein Flp/PilA